MVSLEHYDQIHRSLSIGGTAMIVTLHLLTVKHQPVTLLRLLVNIYTNWTWGPS